MDQIMQMINSLTQQQNGSVGAGQQYQAPTMGYLNQNMQTQNLNPTTDMSQISSLLATAMSGQGGGNTYNYSVPQQQQQQQGQQQQTQQPQQPQPQQTQQPQQPQPQQTQQQAPDRNNAKVSAGVLGTTNGATVYVPGYGNIPSIGMYPASSPQMSSPQTSYTPV